MSRKLNLRPMLAKIAATPYGGASPARSSNSVRTLNLDLVASRMQALGAGSGSRSVQTASFDLAQLRAQHAKLANARPNFGLRSAAGATESVRLQFDVQMQRLRRSGTSAAPRDPMLKALTNRIR